MVSRAAATDATVKVVLARSRDEVVVLAGTKLQTPRLRSERSEGNGEIHELVRLVTHGDDARRRVSDPARVVLLLAHIIYNIFLSLLIAGVLIIDWTDDIDLIILKGDIAFVDIYDVVCVVYPEYRVGSIPVYVMHLGRVGCWTQTHHLHTYHHQHRQITINFGTHFKVCGTPTRRGGHAVQMDFSAYTDVI